MYFIICQENELAVFDDINVLVYSVSLQMIPLLFLCMNQIFNRQLS